MDNEHKIGLHVQNTTNVITVTEENSQEANALVSYKSGNIIKNIIDHNGIVIEIAVDKVIERFS